MVLHNSSEFVKHILRSTMQYDTIVIGLGSAGVTAASTLAKAGRKVLGLEAQDRIGGRVNTVPFGDGVVELGAEWIHGQHPSRVYDTAIQNNITVLSQDLTVDVYQSDGTRGNHELVNELIMYCLALVDDTNTEEDSLGAYITRKLQDHLKETHPELLKDKDFLEEFLSLMDLIVDNYEGSSSWNDVSTTTNYKELEGDQHLSWHRYGYKTFFELLLNTYKGGPGLANLDIKLNTEVVKIVWPQQPSTPVEVTCKDGKVYKANNVIVTVSVGVLKERYSTLFNPPLPEEKALAIQRLPMGLLDKVVLAFPKFKWPGSNFIFQYLKEERNKIVKENGWYIYAASTPMGSSNTLTIWFSGEMAKLSLLGRRCCPSPDLFPSVASYDTHGMIWGGGYSYTATTRHMTLFTPPLPREKVNAINGVTMGVMDKIIFSFDKPWWPVSHTFFVFIWKGEDKRKVAKEDFWTTKIFAASTPMGSGNTLTLWTSGETGKWVETIPEEVVKRKSIELLQKFLGANVTIPEPTGMLRTTWYSNPYTRGSYTFDSVSSVKYPNSRADLGKPLVDSAGTPKVLFAGEATDLTHFSTVHGASESGYREAMRLLPHSKI